MMEPVSETFHRRPNKDVNSGIPRNTVNAAFSDHVSSKSPNSSSAARNNMLLLAIAIPFLILLVFGGRISLLIVCFGGLVCYIFDVIGSVEVTFIAILMTLLGLLGSLVWAARVVVEENLLNFSIVVMMGILLFQLGSVMASYFNVVLSEMGALFEVLDPVIFATLPLVSSSLISWFLCVEIPALDLESTFTCLYFLYALWVLNPRYKGGRDVMKRHQVSSVMISVGSSPTQPVVPRFVMFAVYAIPVVMSMLIHFALHHNVLSTSKTRLIGAAMSFLFPTFLMLVCAKRQIGYWETQQRAGVKTQLSWLTALVGGLMIICLQDHPFLDEIKSFSGYEEPWDSYLLLGVMGTLGWAYWMHGYVTTVKAASDEIDAISATGHQQARTSEYINVLESLVSFSIGISAALVSLIVNIPHKVLPVAVVGAMAVAEYYQRPSWGLTNKILLIFIGAISLAIVAVAFTHNTIFYLMFGFSWHIDLTMQQFCAHFALLCAAAVVVPAIVRPASAGGHGKSSQDFSDLLPGSGGSGGTSGGKYGVFRGIFKKIFGYCLIGLTFVLAAAELMMREQDWSSLEVTVETIYPTSYLIGVTIIVALTTAGLYSARIIGPATTWILVVIQGSKLLHLVGMPSMACASTAAILLTYTLPFIRHIHQYIRMSNELESTQDTNANGTLKIRTLNVFEILFYAATAFLATYLARYHVAYTTLSVLMNNDPSDLQLTTACMALYSLYLSCLLLVFMKKARLLRSVLLVVSLLCTLVATEGLGKLSFALDPTSPTYLTVALHPDMAVNEHTGLFILLSGALSLMAFVGLIPLQNQLVGLVYAVVFSYCSTRATLGWAFPLSLADEMLTHDMLAFPFVYIYTSKFLNCWVALRHTDNNPIITDVMFGIICCMPFAAVVYCYFMGIYDVAIKGIVWSAIISTSSLCITVRTCEFVSDIKLLNRGASVTGNSSSSVINRAGRAQVAHKVMLICVMSSVLCVFWTSVSVALDAHLDRDLLVPLAILLFLTTKKSTLLPDVHPLSIVAMLCSIWWVLSALHAMFVRGFRVDVLAAGAVSGEFHYQQHSIFGLDSDISLWTSGSAWYYHLLHLVMLVLPLPGIVLSFQRNKSDSEDVLFALALMSAIAIVGGPVGSIRYLGLLGGIYAGWRCYDIGRTKKISDRLI